MVESARQLQPCGLRRSWRHFVAWRDGSGPKHHASTPCRQHFAPSQTLVEQDCATTSTIANCSRGEGSAQSPTAASSSLSSPLAETTTARRVLAVRPGLAWCPTPSTATGMTENWRCARVLVIGSSPSARGLTLGCGCRYLDCPWQRCVRARSHPVWLLWHRWLPYVRVSPAELPRDSAAQPWQLQ